MAENEDVFKQVLSELHKHGALESLVWVGSWCQLFYRHHFDYAPEISGVHTLDLDFMVRRSAKVKKEVNIPDILAGLGFEYEPNMLSGCSKYVHPDLEVEFLYPEIGRGKSGSYKIDELHIEAQGLRYLTLLQDHTIKIQHENFVVTVPEPAAYVLHKYIISERRPPKLKHKKEKDLSAATEIGNFLMEKPAQRKQLLKVFRSMPNRWQVDLKTILKRANPALNEYLNKA